MALYRMELYKICHRKLCTLGLLACMGWLLFAFFVQWPSSEQSVVNGVKYKGFSAIQKDREITREYAGRLTDQKVLQIVEQYGLPGLVVRDYGEWQDQNYLNRFVTDYLSDGYLNGWEEGEYKIPEHTIPIRESELGLRELAEAAGDPDSIPFGYMKGWEVFVWVWQFGLLFFSSWIVIMVTPVFAEERQVRMKEILLTTEYGRRKDILARLGAVFTVAGTAYAGMLLLVVAVIGCTYGFSGGEIMAGLATGIPYYPAQTGGLLLWPVWQLAGLYVCVGFISVLATTALTWLISAYSKSTFTTAAIALIVWTLPYLLSVFGGALYWLVAATQPIIWIMYESMIDLIYRKVFHLPVFPYHFLVMTVQLLICMILGYKRNIRIERE